MYGLAVIEGMTLSGHLSNIDEMTILTICNFSLLTYDNFENTHTFLCNVDVP